jgi:prepilin-type N-terminal cleavage/methylation domain-containing protein
VAQRGFTLLEMMLTIILSSIVMLSAITFLVYDARAALQNNSHIEMTRSASLTMAAIGPRIHEAYSGEVSFDLSTGTLTLSADGSSYVQWDSSANELILMPENIVLIDDSWEIRDFYADEWLVNGSWYIHLQLREWDTTYEVNLSCNFTPRDTAVATD